MRTRLWIALVGTAMLLVPAVANCWQSGRLRNQKSTPRAADTEKAGSDATSLSSALSEPDRARAERVIDAQYSRISWEYSLRSALKTASDQNKMVVVDVYADWCGWCKKMDRVVYSDPKVAALGSEVVFLKLNAEDRGEGRQFARQNHISGLPSTFILDQKGSVINRITGYVGSPERFVSLVETSKPSR